MDFRLDEIAPLPLDVPTGEAGGGLSFDLGQIAPLPMDVSPVDLEREQYRRANELYRSLPEGPDKDAAWLRVNEMDVNRIRREELGLGPDDAIPVEKRFWRELQTPEEKLAWSLSRESADQPFAIDVLKRTPLAGGVISTAENIDVLQSAKRIKAETEGKGQADIGDYATVAEFLQRAKASQDRTLLEKVGDLATFLPGFALEFLATGGAFNLGKSATTKLIGEGAESLAGKAVQKGTGWLAGSATQAAANPQQIAANTTARLVPKIDVNEQGNLTVEQREGIPEALAKGYLDTAIEVGTERLGAGIAGVGRGVGKVAGRVPGATRVGRAFDRVGIQGPVEEFLEERVGDVLRGATGVSQDFGPMQHIFSGDAKKRKDAWEQFIAEFTVFSGAGGLRFAAERMWADQPDVAAKLAEKQQPTRKDFEEAKIPMRVEAGERAAFSESLRQVRDEQSAKTGLEGAIARSTEQEVATPAPHYRQSTKTPVDVAMRSRPAEPPAEQPESEQPQPEPRGIAYPPLQESADVREGDWVSIGGRPFQVAWAVDGATGDRFQLEGPSGIVDVTRDEIEGHRPIGRRVESPTAETAVEPQTPLESTIEPQATEGPSATPAAAMPVMTYDEVKAEAKRLGIKIRGTKADLTQRVRAAQEAERATPESTEQPPVTPPPSEAIPPDPLPSPTIDAAAQAPPAPAVPPAARITRPDVEAAFPGTQIEDRSDGWRVHFPAGGHADVVVDELTVDDKVIARYESSRGKKLTPEQKQRMRRFGSFRLRLDDGTTTAVSGLIRLDKNIGGKITLRHEALHLARKAGFIQPAEWDALVREHSKPDRTPQQQEEDIARAVSVWTGPKGLTGRIRKWIQSILKALGITDTSAAEVKALLATEEFWSRPSKLAEEATAVEEPAQNSVEDRETVPVAEAADEPEFTLKRPKESKKFRPKDNEAARQATIVPTDRPQENLPGQQEMFDESSATRVPTPRMKALKLNVKQRDTVWQVSEETGLDPDDLLLSVEQMHAFRRQMDDTFEGLRDFRARHPQVQLAINKGRDQDSVKDFDLMYTALIDEYPNFSTSYPDSQALWDALREGHGKKESGGPKYTYDALKQAADWYEMHGGKSVAEIARDEADRELEDDVPFAVAMPFRQVKQRDDFLPDPVKVDSESVEARLRKAHGVRPKSWLEKAAEFFTSLWHKSTRAQEHLDPADKEFAFANEWFRLLKEVPKTAADETNRTVAAVIDPLGKNQYRLFERFVLVENLLASLERGEPLRFGFESIEEVQRYYKKLTGLVAQIPAVQKAVDTRKRINRELVEQLVEFGLLEDAVLDNVESYYHQQVMQHLLTQQYTGGTKPRPITRSFQKKRVTGVESFGEELDYNTSFIEAEVSWQTEARMELKKEQMLRELADRYDRLPKLKKRAKAENFERLVGGPETARRIHQLRAAIAASFNGPDRNESSERAARAAWIDELSNLDPTYQFRMRIAQNIDRIRQAVEDGEVERQAPSGTQLRLPGIEDPYGNVELVDQMDYDGMEMQGNLIRFLAWLARNLSHTRAGKAALGVFRAMDERNELIREELGTAFREWTDYVRQDATLDVWQPEPGNVWYKAFTIPEKIAEQLHAGIIESAELTKEDLRETLAVAGPKRQMVLPAPLVAQLNEADQRKPAGAVAKTFKGVQDGWKVWTLLSPKRAIGYMLRNVTGDVDPVLGGAPGVLPVVPKAMRQLRNFHKKLGRTADVQRALELGVISSGMTAQEIPDLKDLAIFERFYSQERSLLNIPKNYFKLVRQFNEFRENGLRLAAYLYYKRALDAGTLKHYGGARQETVDALAAEMGNDVAAAHLARNLLGDYGNITVTGGWMRQYLAPFWSYQEINVKRWPRLLINAVKAGGSTEGAISGAALATALTLRLATFYAALWVWNNLLMGGDEEEELGVYDRANPHLIGGRLPDGSIVVLRNVGALGDFLEWFGVNDLMSLSDQLADGQVSAKYVVTEMAKAPFNKVLQGLRPDVKGGVEAVVGVSTFPDAFNPRTQDRGEALANIFGMVDEYRWMKGMVLGDGTRPRPHYWRRSIGGVGVVNPKQTALTEMFDLREKYLTKKGTEYANPNKISDFKPIRDAAFAEDYEAFVEARRAYLEKGKTYENFRKSLEHLDPIAGRLNDSDEREFETQFLNDGQRQKLEVARDYADRMKVTLWQWWKTAEADDPPALRAKLMEQREKDIFGKVKTLATEKPLLRGMKEDRAKQDRWRRETAEAREWLRDRGVTAEEAVRIYRKRADVLEMGRKPSLIRQNLAP